MTPIELCSSQPCSSRGSTMTTSGPWARASRARQRGADAARRQVLVLDVDECRAARDGLEAQHLALRTSGAPRNAGIVRAMPIGASATSGASPRATDRAAAGSARGRGPAARAVAACQRSRASSPARAAAAPSTIIWMSCERAGRGRPPDRRGRVRRPVRGRVPATDVRSRPPANASASSTTTIFWWWSPPNGWRVVEPEGQARVGVPGEAVGREGLAFEREENREVPGEREDPQRGGRRARRSGTAAA